MSSSRIIIAEQGDKSGLVKTYTLADSIFYGAQDSVILDYNCRKAYGSASFTGDSSIVWLYYQPQDADGIFLADPMIIGGYVSTWNIPIYGQFRTTALRLGVRFKDVKTALEKRINLAKDLINSGGSGDNSRYGSIAFLNKSKKILENRIKLIEKQIQKGINNCILTTAMHKINYREKKIIDYVVFNQDFFDTYYPSRAFPIGSPLNYQKSPWVDRDYFVPNLFQFQKDPIIQMDDGINKILPAHQWSLMEVVHTSGSWKIILKITFARISSSKKKSKPTEEPPTPKPVEILPPDEAKEKSIENIKSNDGEGNNDAINEGEQTARGMDRRSSALEGKDKGETKDKLDSYGNSIRGAISGTFVKQSEEMGQKLEGVDVFGPDFKETMDEAIDLIEDMSNLESAGIYAGEEYEKSKERLLEKISDTYGKRAEEMAKAYEDIDVNSPDLEGSEQEILNDLSRSLNTGTGENTHPGILKKFGDKRKERMRSRLQTWEKTDRTKQKFFELPEEIFEDYASMQQYGEVEDEHKNIMENIKDTITDQIRAEINSNKPNEQLIDKLYNLTKKMRIDRMLPPDIKTYFKNKYSEEPTMTVVGQGSAILSGKGDKQKIE